MPNPPTINFTIPFGPVAFRVVVNANGVQPDGTNVPVPDLTSTLTLTGVSGPSAYNAMVDPTDNRRIIVAPALLAPGGTPVPWSFRISVAGKAATVTASGSTVTPAEASGVFWDGNPVLPA